MTKKPGSATGSRGASRTAKPRTSAPPVERILNCLPSKKPEDDWTLANLTEGALVGAAPLPRKVDLREDWWEIGDQGTTGSCVGWATADSVLRWHFVKSGRLEKTARLSPRYVWMASKELDEFQTYPTSFIETSGTYLKTALDVARKYGCVVEEVLPFRPGALYSGGVKTFFALASDLKIANYVNLGTDQTDWRMWIARNGPILTRLVCDSTWMNASKTGGVLAEYGQPIPDGGHAVAIVGYDENGFIVRNSWGRETWGRDGFGFASNAYTAAAFTEAFGVTV